MVLCMGRRAEGPANSGRGDLALLGIAKHYMHSSY